MKLFAALAAVALAAAPAQAAPQWILIAEPDNVDQGVYVNFNSVRGKGSIRSVDFSAHHRQMGLLAYPMHIDCTSWKWSVTHDYGNLPWQNIGKDSTAEGIAYLICPGAKSPAPAAQY